MNPNIKLIGAGAALALAVALGYLLGRTTANGGPSGDAASKEAGREVQYWYDPMYPDKHFDQPGKSPFMDMQLVPKYAQEEPASDEREVLYWYDPMYPDKHFEKPGKSPFMDMDLVPKYAEEGGESGTVRIDSAVAQNLGIRSQTVRVARLERALRVPATVTWDLREAHIVSARVDVIVDELHARAPFEPVRKGEPLATVLAPEWSAAAAEYQALGDAASAEAGALRAAARQRLRTLGLSGADIAGLRPGDPRVVLRAPADGVVAELPVRAGERVNAGMPILRLNGLDRVWLEADVPQSDMSGIGAGTPVTATVSVVPGAQFEGLVESVLPDVDRMTRTQRVRIVLDNPGHRLAPGMFAEVRLAADGGSAHPLVPDEALILTGDDARVILATERGFRVARVRTGHSAGGVTEVLDGLSGGERVVVSGQFLIDSEASLSGALQRMGDTAPAAQSGVPEDSKASAAEDHEAKRIHKEDRP